MSDQPSISVETVIAAPADSVYEAASNLDLLGSLDTEFQGGSWVGGAPRAQGSTFVGRNRSGDREWETTSTVIAAKPGREFSWAVELDEETGDAVATWRFLLRRVPDGTEVSYSVVIGSVPSGLSVAVERHPEAEEQIIDKRLQVFQENMIKTLEGIRRACQ